eukprot:4847176-Prorocentrum_lima.AAC.1
MIELRRRVRSHGCEDDESLEPLISDNDERAPFLRDDLLAEEAMELGPTVHQRYMKVLNRSLTGDYSGCAQCCFLFSLVAIIFLVW